MPGNPLVPRLQGLGTTIFAEMSALALETGSINLGQGFPDVDGPDVIKQAAVDAIWAGRNQYPPGIGVPELRQAIAEHQRRFYGLELDPDTEVLVTAGATEAVAAAMLAMVDVGRRGHRAGAVLRLVRRIDRHGRRRAGAGHAART